VEIAVRKLIGILCLLALFGLAAYTYHYFGTPEYSLYKLGNAIHQKDYETARYYVDEDRVSEDVSTSIVDVTMKQTMEQMQNDLKDNPFGGLGTGLIQMMVPQLKATARQQAKDTIDSLLGKDAPLDSIHNWPQFRSSTFAGVKVGRVDVAGNTADVAVDNLPKDLPIKMTELHVRMARIPDSRSWRVVGLPDLAPIFAQLLQDAKAGSPTKR
jgi:hypothetical protein